MAKVFIEETTLTAIGDAIRGKTGKTDLIDPALMGAEIASIETGGGGEDIEPIVLTGDCSYTCAGSLSGYYIDTFPSKISTEDITNASSMFAYNNTIKTIPFKLNLREGSCVVSNMFTSCAKLEHVPDLDFKHTSYTDMIEVFMGCNAIKNVPKIINAYPYTMVRFFNGCVNLRELPDNFFDTWNFSRVMTNSTNMAAIFSTCRSLRKIPTSLFERMYNWGASSGAYSAYREFAGYCSCLDEVVNMPVVTKTLTSNHFQGTVDQCHRLTRFTFKTNDDGTPKTANWKSQTLYLGEYIGHCMVGYNYLITDYNSGITEDKRVTDDASYQALKNDPDWWTTERAYCRYNHDSAVETINSLPDTSAYGTNTITFYGAAGSKTDGGAVNTLTEAEIAVAAAKGWTVTLM